MSMKLIYKEKLIDEINKRLSICNKVALDLRNSENKDYYQGKAESYKETLDILDALETKEVDLEKEYDMVFFNDPVLKKFVNRNAGICIARHFFELGLKASSPTITADQENEWNELSIKPPFIITMDGNKYSKPMLCYDKFGNYCIAQYVRLQTGYCGWYDGEEEVSITHWKELKAMEDKE